MSTTWHHVDLDAPDLARVSVAHSPDGRVQVIVHGQDDADGVALELGPAAARELATALTIPPVDAEPPPRSGPAGASYYVHVTDVR